MNRKYFSFSITDSWHFKKLLLHWSDREEVCCFLDNHQYPSPYNSYECIVAAGVKTEIIASYGEAFNGLAEFYSREKDWIFGHLGYDLKNELEQLHSSHPDGIGLPDLYFFVPRVLILLKNNELLIGCFNPQTASSIFSDILATAITVLTDKPYINIQSRISHDEYILAVEQLQSHIRRGDCYEITFCQEFFAENVSADPLQLYVALSSISPNPFSAFYKVRNKYLCCASPERYLKKQGEKIISQPIKGTKPRNHDNEAKDLFNLRELVSSAKEKSENVMIVDLVRNDLSRICNEGSVKVEELYGVYPFPQVHQMISTITGILPIDTHCVEALRTTFPMGSMTGAPKKRVMQLIEQYEKSKRGLFSGAVGYITPDANFDFNVVIRSMLYNHETNYLSYQVGSAITFYSEPEKEYEECLLKAAAINEVLSGSIPF